MKTKMGASRCCCVNCTTGTDDFEDGTLNPKWVDIVGTPVEAGGVLTIQSDDGEYVVWEDDPLLEVGTTGISVEFDVRFDKEPDHPTTTDAYGQGHGFDMIWDWRGEDEFMALKLVFNGSLANPTLRLVVNNEIDGSGSLGTLELNPDFLPTDWVHVKACIFRDDDYYGYGYGYGYYGEGPWRIYIRAEDREAIFSIPEPENLRTGLGAKIVVSGLGTADNPYEADNWKLSKINANCKCEVPQPCEAMFRDFGTPDTSDLPEWEEESGLWEVIDEELVPPTDGRLIWKGSVPSIIQEGVKWEWDVNFAGASGVLRLQVNITDADYVYMEVTCIDENEATIQLFDSDGNELSILESITGFSWNDWHIIALCQDEESLVGTANGTVQVDASFTSMSGLNLAIEVEGMSPDARLDNAVIQRLLPNCEKCQATESCGACAGNIAPKTLKVRFAGITGDYAKLNGLYFLKYVNCGGSYEYHSCVGGESPQIDNPPCGMTTVRPGGGFAGSPGAVYSKIFPPPTSLTDFVVLHYSTNIFGDYLITAVSSIFAVIVNNTGGVGGGRRLIVNIGLIRYSNNPALGSPFICVKHEHKLDYKVELEELSIDCMNIRNAQLDFACEEFCDAANNCTDFSDPFYTLATGFASLKTLKPLVSTGL